MANLDPNNRTNLSHTLNTGLPYHLCDAHANIKTCIDQGCLTLRLDYDPTCTLLPSGWLQHTFCAIGADHGVENVNR